MHRFIAIALCAYASSFATLIVIGGTLLEFIFMPVAASSITICLWVAMTLIADYTYRPRLDAAAMMEGVCPECRTFNSLQEVTSADPNHRYVDCMACKEHIRVTHHGDHFIAERLGKTVD